MNKHIFVDNLTANLGAFIAGRNKFFAKSIKSKPFKELVEAIEISIPNINSEETHKMEAKTPDGALDTAFRVEKWLGYHYPTIIYHHGNNERPFNYEKGAKNTFFNVFVRNKNEFNANLVVVRAPFHNCSLRTYQNKMVDLMHFMTMIATAVKLNEIIIQQLRKKSSKVIITSGISLGGWASNLHRSIYNSSTAYASLMAGTYLGELFLQSKYRKLTGEKALQAPKVIQQLLNFNTDFEKRKDKNVFPLLARYDQFIQYEVQKESYNGHSVKVMESGHVTGALRSQELRTHILGILEQLTA